MVIRCASLRRPECVGEGQGPTSVGGVKSFLRYKSSYWPQLMNENTGPGCKLTCGVTTWDGAMLGCTCITVLVARLTSSHNLSVTEGVLQCVTFHTRTEHSRHASTAQSLCRVSQASLGSSVPADTCSVPIPCPEPRTLWFITAFWVAISASSLCQGLHERECTAGAQKLCPEQR